MNRGVETVRLCLVLHEAKNVLPLDGVSTLDIAELLKAHAPDQSTGVDLAKWSSDEQVAALKPKTLASSSLPACSSSCVCFRSLGSSDEAAAEEQRSPSPAIWLVCVPIVE